MAEHSEAGRVAQVAPVLAYAIVIEWGPNNLSAYVPDLPGCVTTGRTVDEVLTNMQEAIGLHLEGMAEDGEPIPAPRTRVAMVEVAAPAPGVAA